MTTYTVGERGNGANGAFDLARGGAASETDRAREDAEASVRRPERGLDGASRMNGIETVALAAYCFLALAALTVLAAALVHYLT